MAINLNHAMVQGYVVSVYEGEGNAKVTLVVRDDYKNRDGDVIERPYFMPITFFGQQGENLVRLVNVKDFLTVEFKVTSYKPQDQEYHTLSLVGEAFYLTPRQNNDSDNTQKSNKNSNKNNSRPTNNKSNKNAPKRGDRTQPNRRPAPVEDDVDDGEDWGDLPPWGDE